MRLNKEIAVKQILKLVFTVLLLVSGMANAGDGLYGKVPPTDAAFFRFVNISSQAVDIEFKGKKLPQSVLFDLLPMVLKVRATLTLKSMVTIFPKR